MSDHVNISSSDVITRPPLFIIYTLFSPGEEHPFAYLTHNTLWTSISQQLCTTTKQPFSCTSMRTMSSSPFIYLKDRCSLNPIPLNRDSATIRNFGQNDTNRTCSRNGKRAVEARQASNMGPTIGMIQTETTLVSPQNFPPVV